MFFIILKPKILLILNSEQNDWHTTNFKLSPKRISMNRKHYPYLENICKSKKRKFKCVRYIVATYYIQREFKIR